MSHDRGSNDTPCSKSNWPQVLLEGNWTLICFNQAGKKKRNLVNMIFLFLSSFWMTNFIFFTLFLIFFVLRQFFQYSKSHDVRIKQRQGRPSTSIHVHPQPETAWASLWAPMSPHKGKKRISDTFLSILQCGRFYDLISIAKPFRALVFKEKRSTELSRRAC